MILKLSTFILKMEYDDKFLYNNTKKIGLKFPYSLLKIIFFSMRKKYSSFLHDSLIYSLSLIAIKSSNTGMIGEICLIDEYVCVA